MHEDSRLIFMKISEMNVTLCISTVKANIRGFSTMYMTRYHGNLLTDRRFLKQKTSIQQAIGLSNVLIAFCLVQFLFYHLGGL
jgi:hypothetical protein